MDKNQQMHTQSTPPPCPLCSIAQTVNYDEIDSVLLLRCPKCQLVFRAPRPEPGNLFSELDEGYFVGRDEEQYVKERRMIFRGLLNRLEKHQKVKGRLLDIGCARGALLLEAESIGYQAFGIDLSVGELKAAHRLGLSSIVLGLPESSPFMPASFSVITMFDFIEHALMPGEVMNSAAETLAPGGLLALFTGNVECKRARREKASWEYVHKSGHLNFFSNSSLRYMMEHAGLKIIERQMSTVDAGADKTLQNLGFNTARLRAIFNKQLLPLKKIIKAMLGKAVGGEGIFIIAQKQ